jgi:hypothetical protein
MNVHGHAKLGPAGRRALVEAIERGASLRQAAARPGVSVATAHRWWGRWRAPRPRDHLGHDIDVVLECEQARQRPAHHRPVLRDQDADHAASIGTPEADSESSRRPCPGLERAVEVARPLREARQADAAVPVTGNGGSVVVDFERDVVTALFQRGHAAAGVAVADDVGGSLADGQAEDALDLAFMYDRVPAARRSGHGAGRLPPVGRSEHRGRREMRMCRRADEFARTV